MGPWTWILLIVALLLLAAAAGGLRFDLLMAEIRDFATRHHIKLH
jgi:hypothetical protein